MIAAVLLDAVVIAAVPAGVPFSDSPVPVARLSGLGSHPWHKGYWTARFRIDRAGRGLETAYVWKRGETFSSAMSRFVFFTEHKGVIIASSTGQMLRYEDELDQIKPTENCFQSQAIRWTARDFYLREMNASATLRANPWLGRTVTSDGICPLKLGELSSGDQERLDIRWGRERKFNIGPAPPPPAPAIGPPLVLDAHGHLVNKSARDHGEADWVPPASADLKRRHRSR